MLKCVNVLTNEIDEIVNNSKSQIQFDSGPKDDSTKEFLDRPFIANEVRK
jgi:hypothetical protein